MSFEVKVPVLGESVSEATVGRKHPSYARLARCVVGMHRGTFDLTDKPQRRCW